MIFKRNRHAAEDMVRQQVPKRPRQPDPEEDQRYSPSDHPAPFRQPRESQLPRNTRVQKPVVDTPDTQSTRFYPSIPGSTHGQLRSQPVRPLDQHTERQQEPRAREVPNHRARPLNSIQDASPGVRQPLLGDSHKTPLIPVGAWAAGSENEQSGDTGLSDNHKKLEQENDRLSEELDLLRKKYATLETSNQKKLEKAAKENESLRDKLQDAEDAIESTSNSHHKLEKKYNDLCERHERLWKENEALNARHQRLMGTDKALQVKYNKLVAEDRNLEAKFRELEKHSASVQADLYEALEREETRKKEELAKGPSLPKIADDIITGKWKALEISIRNLVMNHLSWTTHASLELVNGPHGGISGCTTMRKGTELCLVENSMELGLAILRAFIWRFLSQAVFFNEYGVWGGEFGARFSAACQCLPSQLFPFENLKC
jgi:predicted nuclease with TOPRIM domain